MAKKKCKCPPPGPNMAYMISFGDTMTALLAFFIVLNSMAETQNGANLHAGTGSFVSSTSSFGLPGLFMTGRSKQAFQHRYQSPHYVVPSPDGETKPGATSGPDEDGDSRRILNYQLEQFQNFLHEMERSHSMKQETDIDGEMNVDVLGSLPHEGRLMNRDIEAAVKGTAPMLRRPDVEVEITVWCTMPSKVAWTRAVRQAAQIRQEVIELLHLPPDQQARLSALARPWLWTGLRQDRKKYPDKDTIVKRPALSVTVRVTKNPQT